MTHYRPRDYARYWAMNNEDLAIDLSILEKQMWKQESQRNML